MTTVLLQKMESHYDEKVRVLEDDITCLKDENAMLRKRCDKAFVALRVLNNLLREIDPEAKNIASKIYRFLKEENEE